VFVSGISIKETEALGGPNLRAEGAAGCRPPACIGSSLSGGRAMRNTMSEFRALRVARQPGRVVRSPPARECSTRPLQSGGRLHMNEEPGTVFDAHVRAEFVERSVDATMATMTDAPYVTHVPVLTGGHGRNEVRALYGSCFVVRWRSVDEGDA